MNDIQTLPEGKKTTLLDQLLPRSIAALLNSCFSLSPGYRHASQHGIYKHPDTNKISLDVYLVESGTTTRTSHIAELVNKQPNGSTERETWKIGNATFEVDEDRRELFTRRRQEFRVIDLEGKRYCVYQA